jgi:Protease II
MTTIPKLRKETNRIKVHGHELRDDYAWIKQGNWQEVLKNPAKLNTEVQNYLHQENNFVQQQLKDKEQLRETIFQELKNKIKDKDSSVPLKTVSISILQNMQRQLSTLALKEKVQKIEWKLFLMHNKEQKVKHFLI